jgi:hypothetical protein
LEKDWGEGGIEGRADRKTEERGEQRRLKKEREQKRARKGNRIESHPQT